MVLILMVWCIDGAGCVEDLGEASREVIPTNLSGP